MAVHPRMRGERCTSVTTRRATTGSSPHARGTHDQGQGQGEDGRFIPACAGNACCCPCCCCAWAVHPRMRGERLSCAAERRCVSGSSPHARGTPKGKKIAPSKNRFIPACAGNAHDGGLPVVHTAVHPRMRGERNSPSEQLAGGVGSSPHARGTLDTHLPPLRHRRFIPACAGNAVNSLRSRKNIAVHPRMRGERRGGCPDPVVDDGSSPHARGTLRCSMMRRAGTRFIPACAGNATNWPLG